MVNEKATYLVRKLQVPTLGTVGLYIYFCTIHFTEGISATPVIGKTDCRKIQNKRFCKKKKTPRCIANC